MKKQSVPYILLLLLVAFYACKKDTVVDIKDIIQVDSVQLTNGATLTISQDTTTVIYGNLQVQFTQTSTCYPSTEIFTFKATGVTLPAGGYYKWSFGDGNTATGSTVTYSYQAASSFVANLFVMANTNITLAKISFPLKAWGKQNKPEAIFTIKSDFPANLNYITFNSASSVNHGDIVNYVYNWGDGTSLISSVGLVRHEFPKKINDTTYPVKLTITTNTGCKDDTTMNLTIPGTYNIKGSFKAAAFDACINEKFVFTAEAENVPTGAIYEWNFADGKGTKTGNPINYKYQYSNDYDVIMYVKLNDRLLYSTHKLVNAKGENPKPKALFEETLVAQNATTQRWSFNSRSTIPTSAIDSYQWSFGNGNTNNDFYSFIETIYNRETTDKSYKVQLIVTGNGCADTASKVIFVPKF